MTQQRLPTVNGDDGTWGDILNQYIAKEHYNTGTDNAANGGHQKLTLQPGTTAANTAPIKLSSGSLMTAAEAGAIEFLTDKLYFTQTTSTIRNTIAAYNDSSGATGDLYYRDSSANFTRLAIGGATGQVMTVNSGIPAWITVLSGTTKITVGTSEPSSPTTGDLWIDTT